MECPHWFLQLGCLVCNWCGLRRLEFCNQMEDSFGRRTSTTRLINPFWPPSNSNTCIRFDLFFVSFVRPYSHKAVSCKGIKASIPWPQCILPQALGVLSFSTSIIAPSHSTKRSSTPQSNKAKSFRDQASKNLYFMGRGIESKFKYELLLNLSIKISRRPTSPWQTLWDYASMYAFWHIKLIMISSYVVMYVRFKSKCLA